MEEELSIIIELESPFRWRPVVRNENRYEFDLEQEDAGTYSFLNFCARIVLAYDEFLNRDKAAGYELLQQVDKHLQELEDSNCQDALFKNSKDALFHVVLACKTQMAIFGRQLGNEISEWMQKVKKLAEMNASNKAAMFAIKALAHSLYSNDGLDTSLSQINMALMQDDTTPYWWFIKGTVLLKQRSLNEVPSLQEREAFKNAHEKESSNPLFMVYLADSLRESCNYKPRTYLWFIAKSAQVNVEDKINEKYAAASELYRKSYELKPNCPVIAFKCASGLMRLPPQFRDVKLIKKIISDCEKKFPNSGFGNLVCALYYEQINKKIAQSQRFLEKCVELNIFTGCMNSIRLDFAAKKEDANVVERLEKMLDIFTEASRQEIIISQLISYFVFITADIEKACEYMLKYYRKKSSGRHLEKHKSCFKSTDGAVSLVDVITDQVKLKLRDHRLPKEKRKFYNDFVRQMSFHNVEVLKGNPKNLLEQIQKSAVPKGKNPNKAHSNEAQRNSSSQPNRQSNDRNAPRNDEQRRRQDAPPDRRAAGRGASPRRRDGRRPEDRPGDQRPDGRFGRPNTDRENAQKFNSSLRSRDDRNPEDRPGDQRPPFLDKRPDGQFGRPNSDRENAQKFNSSLRRRDDRRPEDGPIDHRPSSEKWPDKRLGRSVSGLENRQKNEFSSTRRDDHRPEDRRVDGRPAPFDKQPHPEVRGRGENIPKNDVGARREGQPEERANLPAALPDKSTAVVKTKPAKSDSDQDYQMLMGMLRESKDVNAIMEKWKLLSLKENGHSNVEATRTVPEEYSRQQSDHRAREAQHEVTSDGGSRGLEDRRRDRSFSETSDRSHRRRHRHREHNEADEDVVVSKERRRRSKDGSSGDRRRDPSLSEVSTRSHRRKHRHRSDKKHGNDSEGDDKHKRRHSASSRKHRRRSEERLTHKSHGKHRGSEPAADLDGSIDRQSRKSHRKHRKSESATDLDGSVDRHSRKSHRKHRKSESATDLDGSVDRQSHRSHRKHRKSESATNLDGSVDRQSHRSHRKHRKSESATDLDGSVDRQSHKSHRKHRKSVSESDRERSDRKREREKHSRHRSKRHSSKEHHREKHRDHEKSSRRKKDSRKGTSDSEKSDGR